VRTIPILLVACAVLAVPLVGAEQSDLRAPSDVVSYRTADGKVLLVWNPVVGATHYAVFRAQPDGHFALAYDGTTPAFYDMTPTGTSYLIVAYDFTGAGYGTSYSDSNPHGDCVSIKSDPNKPGLSYSVTNCIESVPIPEL
jgi:hypothetical protein